MAFLRSRLLLALTLVFVCTAAVAPWTEDVPTPFQQDLSAQLDAIDADDAQANFDFGFALFEHNEAKTEEDLNRLETAARAMERALDADPDHPYAATLLEQVEAAETSLEKQINPDLWGMAFMVIGGLGIFLIGMKNMSEGMQAVAGTRLRKMINAVTDNRLLAVGVGTGVTCLVQSSSITTVIVVGLVNSGLMQLHQAIGVIMGANIGTTITGWILVLKIGKYGLPLLGVSVFGYLFSKRDTVRYIAMGLMGLGMVFFGLEMMKNGFKPMRSVPMFQEAFAWFVADSYFGVLKCALAGCLLTFLVQSSSATLGITIGLASIGAIPFQTAAALVLGENIGTTITAWLASIGTTTVAKRAAYAHVMFNLLGVAWVTAVFAVYVQLVGRFVEWESGVNPLTVQPDHPSFAQTITFSIAAVHTGFNITNTLLFVPFVRPFARLLERLFPDRGAKEIGRLTNLDMRLIESPVLAIETSRGEILKMADGVNKMMDWTRQVMAAPDTDEELVRNVLHRETVMDNVQEEVIQFLTDVLSAETPYRTAVEARQQLRIADEYESVSDYISTVLKARLRLDEVGLSFTQPQLDEILALHDRVADYVRMITDAFRAKAPDVLVRATSESDAVTAIVKSLRSSHVESLSDSRMEPVLSMAYSTMLNGYRKVKDHALNIAESMAATG